MNLAEFLQYGKKRMSEDSAPRRLGPTPTSDFREDSAQTSRRFGPEVEKIRPTLCYCVFIGLFL